jgi:uncharacterized protein DUF6256
MTPTGEIWRRIVPPLVAAFAVFVAMLRVASRTTVSVPTADEHRTWAGFVRYLAATASTGYLVMLAIVLVFHVVLADDHGAFTSAAAGGAALLAIALPVFVVAEALARRGRP